MAKRRAYLHIGLPHSGGAFLCSALVEHARQLEQVGLRHPAISEEETFRAAIEVQRVHKRWGYERREVEGVWSTICRRGRKGKGDLVLSQELFAASDPAQIALMLDALAGFDVHVVVTARDLGTQMVAAWTGTVEAGRSLSFERFRRRVSDPGREHEQARRFWAEQDLGEVLDRWAAAVRAPERVHVVVVPADDPDPRRWVWSAFAAIVGFDTDELPLGTELPPVPGTTGVAVMRTVNRAVDGRLSRRTQRAVVRRYLTEGVSADGAAPALPEDLEVLLAATGERWRQQVLAGGYDVHGDLADLMTAPADAGAALPDDVPVEEQLSLTTDVLATVLVEVARLREHNRVLEQEAAALARKQRSLKRKLENAG